MTRKSKSEAEKLAVLVGLIPEKARMDYEREILSGRTLGGTIQVIDTTFKLKRVFSAVPLVAIVLFVIFALVFEEQIRMVPRTLFPWMVLGLAATMLGIFCWSWRMEGGCEKAISNYRQVFLDLEKNFKPLGLSSLKDLVEGQVRPRLQYLATAVVTAQRLFDALCFAKNYNRNQVIAAGPSVPESELNLKRAIASAGLFGFKFNEKDLMEEAEKGYKLPERLANPSQV
jgi:hypothetical protein